MGNFRISEFQNFIFRRIAPKVGGGGDILQL